MDSDASRALGPVTKALESSITPISYWFCLPERLLRCGVWGKAALTCTEALPTLLAVYQEGLGGYL